MVFTKNFITIDAFTQVIDLALRMGDVVSHTKSLAVVIRALILDNDASLLITKSVM